MHPEAASTFHPPADFVRARAAASILGISYSFFRVLLRRGEGPPSIRLGRTRLFNVASLQAYMKAREAQ